MFHSHELTDAVRQYEREHSNHYHKASAAIESLFNVSYGHAGLIISRKTLKLTLAPNIFGFDTTLFDNMYKKV